MSMQDLPQRPRPRKRTERMIGDDLFILDDEKGVVYHLNSGAALIWFLCDGQHDLGGMASEIAGAFSLLPEKVLVEVRQAVAEFQTLGLLETQ